MANRVLVEKEIRKYCELNNINDVPGFITQCMVRGFNIFKYGTSPGDNIKRQNGDIIDNGSNKTHKKKENTKTTKSVNKEENKVEPEVISQQVEVIKNEEKSEVILNNPVVIKKKRKITVTNID
jgi:hypothetical protein